MSGGTSKPGAADVNNALAEAILGRIHTSIPATILSYDRETQKAVVAVIPCSRRRVSGAVECFRPEPIPNVPVLFPSSSGFSITFPLSAGDPVLLIVAERSIAEWLVTGEAQTEPSDPRRFDLTDAIAIPGPRSFAAPLDAEAVSETALVVAGDDIRLGAASASAFLALANLVESELAALWSALNGHIHSGVTTGAGVSGPSSTSGSAGSVASSKVRSE